MQPREERWADAQLAQEEPTQQAVLPTHGFWLSVMMAPLSPDG